MAAHLSLFLITHLQKLTQAQEQPQKGSFAAGSWMWNPRQSQDDDDDSWEVRAFAEDAANIMGSTWPPRSYTCTFCRREFRSAQALGGHMNVHRRDRARLRQLPRAATADPSSTFIIRTPEFHTNCGCSPFYPLPNPTNFFTPTTPMESLSLGLTISPYLLRSSGVSSCRSSSINFPVATGIHTSSCHPNHTNGSSLPLDGNKKNSSSNNNEDMEVEELDLELRLGQKPSQ